ncbi:TetR family transcriptional regulator [Pseudorhodoplanes sinuspersici]|uniref:TetR family transcriptional regulator n=1 Tax=Pseudorhodoplanes sinuspersici TaxID=1235591 RepID=A0A1W6ZV25_9HYPH|nr:TetR family transcriptional regulator [Pseudorhodoplanes sinuspersici]ARQ00615.1 TetR family transcriptional regulator [Pseudorhodoplanes sinuspersici]RKE72213.1 TetR family transcriptional regulator [Pseudorhodoplanes sinuspersici]
MDAAIPKTKAARRPPGERDPERTRASILAAATGEFTAHGLDGARVDEIARRSGVNKRMIYYYFGDKNGLYLAVLEGSYADIRNAEINMHLTDRDPADAMRELVAFTWNYFIEHPEFLSLLNTENLHRARHLKTSKKIRELHSPLVGIITALLERGVREKVFRTGVDPVQLYVSIASLGFFYMSNRFTLSTIFGRDLSEREALAERGKHIEDVVLGYLRP